MSTKGFTLVELMLTVSVLGILAAIVSIRANEALRRSQEAMTKSNLATLRLALSVYVATNGTSPTVLQDVTTQTDPVMTQIPYKWTPPYHPKGNSVTNGPISSLATSHGDWFYFSSRDDSEYGKVIVNCNHQDIKGKNWDRY